MKRGVLVLLAGCSHAPTGQLVLWFRDPLDAGETITVTATP